MSAAGRLTAAELGRAGERAAARHLEGLGYAILGSGFLARRGEIDLVCRRDGRVLLVEVKTRSSDAFGTPAEAVDARKRRALAAAAAGYRALSGWRGPIDFAVLSLRAGAGGEVEALELVADPF